MDQRGEDLVRSAILLTDECTQEFWAHLAGAGRVVPRRQVQSIEGLSLERMKAMAILKGPTLETLHQEAPIQPDRLGV